MTRRRLLTALAALRASAALPRRYRAAVIGHTGHGNYGHGLDIVWKAFPNVDVVAVADADEAGRAQAQTRTGAKRAYADYRQMLEKEKPDLVSIGPRWLDQRVAMVEAAAASGAHIYMEKPFAQNLEEGDRICAAVERRKVKLQIAHQMRGSPYIRRIQELVAAGEIGVLHEVRGRGKEDRRAGGEDLMVLGSHICDVMRIFLGDPQWVTAHVTAGGAEISRSSVGKATEPIGPIAGTEIAAMFAFRGGVHGYFASKAADETHPLRFGTQLIGTKGVIFIPNAIYPDGQPWILRTPSWFPGESDRWEKIRAKNDVPGMTELAGDAHVLANALMVLDLLQSIEQRRKPICSEVDGRWTIEMISGIYQAQKTGGRVTFPLKDRRHPLETL